MLHHLELLVNNEQLVVHTPALETSTTNACDNNNVQEMAASEITYAQEVATEVLSASDDTVPRYKVIIVDGMALVNTIHKTDQIKTCNDFTEVFLDQLINMADNTMK
jgi:hypothetical protein